jgi:hypothetical protein
MMLFSPLLASAALFTMGMANPMPAGVFAKRGESIHLAVCESLKSPSVAPRSIIVVSSYICHLLYVSPSYYDRQYCPNDNNCQLGNDPNPFISVNVVDIGLPSFKWEGTQHLAEFRTEVKFSFHIDADAKSKPNYTPVE